MQAQIPTIHASAILVGAHAVLIRGVSGAGKSRLALALLERGETGLLPFCRLIGDDRVHLEPAHGRLLVRPSPALAGLIEIRGIGLRRMRFEPVAVVGLVIDLGVPETERLPVTADLEAVLAGIRLPRLPVAAGHDPLSLTLARLREGDSSRFWAEDQKSRAKASQVAQK